MKLLAGATLAAVLLVAACGDTVDRPATATTAVDASLTLNALFE